MLLDCEAKRPPALRRSLREDYLYASDLPGIVTEETLKGFIINAESAGWDVIREGGWIQMRRRIPELPDDWYRGGFEGGDGRENGSELECCASLLARHPNPNEKVRGEERQSGESGSYKGKREGETEIIALIKAGEEGERAVEKLCREMHREWAERLRKKEPLPPIPAERLRINQE